MRRYLNFMNSYHVMRSQLPKPGMLFVPGVAQPVGIVPHFMLPALRDLSHPAFAVLDDSDTNLTRVEICPDLEGFDPHSIDAVVARTEAVMDALDVLSAQTEEQALGAAATPLRTYAEAISHCTGHDHGKETEGSADNRSAFDSKSPGQKEQTAVVEHFGAQPLLALPRAAAPLFGIKLYHAVLNLVCVAKGADGHTAGPAIWLKRRTVDASIVGGLPATTETAEAKEAGSAASKNAQRRKKHQVGTSDDASSAELFGSLLHVPVLAGAPGSIVDSLAAAGASTCGLPKEAIYKYSTAVSSVSYLRWHPGVGIVSDTMFVFDLPLPPQAVPAPANPSDVYSMFTLKHCVDLVRDSAVDPLCALILGDVGVRHGLYSPDNAVEKGDVSYCELTSHLRAPVS